jgi:hypothetical protein
MSSRRHAVTGPDGKKYLLVENFGGLGAHQFGGRRREAEKTGRSTYLLNGKAVSKTGEREFTTHDGQVLTLD